MCPDGVQRTVRITDLSQLQDIRTAAEMLFDRSNDDLFLPCNLQMPNGNLVRIRNRHAPSATILQAVGFFYDQFGNPWTFETTN
jgi:hypothetical protein